MGLSHIEKNDPLSGRQWIYMLAQDCVFNCVLMLLIVAVRIKSQKCDATERSPGVFGFVSRFKS